MYQPERRCAYGCQGIAPDSNLAGMDNRLVGDNNIICYSC